LTKVGGLEIGAMAGGILGGAAFHLSMGLGGFLSGGAALLAPRLCWGVHHYLFFSLLSPQNGHRFFLAPLKLAPVLELEMRLGEGTGACVLMGMIEASAKILREMATFESACVEKKLP